MWKRIHSNRDPKDTLFSEVRKEFRPYFDQAGNASKGLLARYPKFFFGVMVALMLASVILAFTLSRHHKPARPLVVKQQVSPIQDGFSQIMQAAEKIRETLRLKHLVDSISAKKLFTTADSAALDTALDRLRQLRKTK